MAIGQRYPSGVVVVIGRIIHPTCGVRVARVEAIHVHSEMVVLDAILALVEDDVQFAQRFAGGINRKFYSDKSALGQALGLGELEALHGAGAGGKLISRETYALHHADEEVGEGIIVLAVEG